MKATGRMISNMVMDAKFGLLVATMMVGSLERSAMGMDTTNGTTVKNISGSLSTTTRKGKEFSHGLTGSSMTVSGTRTRERGMGR